MRFEIFEPLLAAGLYRLAATETSYRRALQEARLHRTPLLIGYWED